MVKNIEKIARTTSKRKRAMYKAKKVAIKKKIARNVGSTFAWTTVLNNAGKALKKWFK